MFFVLSKGKTSNGITVFKELYIPLHEAESVIKILNKLNGLNDIVSFDGEKFILDTKIIKETISKDILVSQERLKFVYNSLMENKIKSSDIISDDEICNLFFSVLLPFDEQSKLFITSIEYFRLLNDVMYLRIN